MAHWLHRLLSPRSVAIVGASERDGSLAAATHRLLLEHGYPGRIYSVNPRYQHLHGAKCYATLADLPAVPDLVVYAISGIPLERSFDEAIKIGVGGVVIYASNYIENDEHPKLTERLRRKARAAGIPVCGGNSMGFYNYDDQVMLSFDRPPENRPAGHIALVVHSGSVMTYLANNDARFCFNHVIHSGQETNASVADYMDYLLQRESTRVIAIFLETVRDAPAFVEALKKARARSLPVVIARVGRTEKSAQMAMSHSGAIVGDQQALEALCRRHGAILCRDADEMIATATLFAAGFRVDGGALASMLDSGGLREQMMDLADEIGVAFARISETTTAVLRERLEAGLDAVNPMDGMGALAGDIESVYLACGKALLDDPDTGLLSFEFEFRDGFSHYPQLFDVARKLAIYNDKPVILLNSSGFSAIGRSAAQLTHEGIPVLNGVDLALRAIANLLNYDARPSAQGQAPEIDFDDRLVGEWKPRIVAARHLDESDSLQLMSDFGFPAIDFLRAANREQLLAAAESIGYPLVLKTARPDLAHKSEHGGVKVGLVDRASLEAAYGDLASRLDERVLLMPMAEAGIEVSIGMKNDRQFGPLVVVACGGVLIELLAERAVRLAPLNREQADEMLDEIRLGRLLAGLRGQPPANRDALLELILRFAALAVEFSDSIAEIDLNPVIVTPSACTIVDALIVSRAARGDEPRQATSEPGDKR